MCTRKEGGRMYLDYCNCGKKSEIELRGYAEAGALLSLCQRCAIQVVRKLAEDLCALGSGRHG